MKHDEWGEPIKRRFVWKSVGQVIIGLLLLGAIVYIMTSPWRTPQMSPYEYALYMAETIKDKNYSVSVQDGVKYVFAQEDKFTAIYGPDEKWMRDLNKNTWVSVPIEIKEAMNAGKGTD